MENLVIKTCIERGSYVRRNYNEEISSIQNRMNEFDYHYFIKTDGNILVFTTKNEVFEMPLKEFDYMLLWNKLDNITVDDGIEQPFEHFEVGTDKYDIWHWFEWFFDISIGKDIIDKD
jgi:hypothetical protein